MLGGTGASPRPRPVARGKVKAVIVAVEATVNEARNQCKKKNIYHKENKIINHYGITPPPRLNNKLLLLLISWQHI